MITAHDLDQSYLYLREARRRYLALQQRAWADKPATHGFIVAGSFMDDAIIHIERIFRLAEQSELAQLRTDKKAGTP